MEELIDVILGNTVIAPEVYSADVVLVNLLVAMVLGMIIATAYKQVHRGISYSQSYVFSIVVVTMTVALAMMVIGNDITRAFALLGTFTIIRYRTAVKDPKDTAFIFIALVVGLAIGASNYGIGIAGTFVMVAAVLFLHLTNFGAATKTDQVLYLTAGTEFASEAQFEEVLRGLFKKARLLNVSFESDGQRTSYTYNVSHRRGEGPSGAVAALRQMDGVERVEVLTAQNIVEF